MLQVASGSRHSCALLSPSRPHFTPQPIHYVHPCLSQAVLQVAAGSRHSCALLGPSRRVKCWGRNRRGQLGYGDDTQRGGAAGSMGANLPYVNLGTAPDGQPYAVQQVQ